MELGFLDIGVFMMVCSGRHLRCVGCVFDEAVLTADNYGEKMLGGE
jgi:hypothetical protein